MTAPHRSLVVLLQLVMTGSAGLLLAAGAHAQPPSARPNIIFIFLDDHAYQAISAYGSRINQTPHIDRLATGGMRFDQCYVPNSICAPVRATVQTGKYPHKHGVITNRNRFDNTQWTFPGQLQAAGYQTAFIGKWHLKSEPVGFDHYERLVGQGPYYNPRMIRNGEQVRHTGYTTHVITDLALEWLKEQRDPEKPFMLMYQHKAPHRPWDPGPDYLNHYDDVFIPEPPTLFEDYPERGLAVRQQDMTIAETLSDRDLKFVPPPNLTPEQQARWDAAYGPKNQAFRQAMLSGRDLVRWKYQRYIKDYLRCIAAVDDDLGRLLDYLDEADLADDTVVIYTSDQGFYLGEHGWFDKRWMYEETLRTPLIVRWPGVVEAGTFCDAIVSPIDFAPTLLDIASARWDEPLDGRSFLPLLKGQTPTDWRDTFYYHYYEYPGSHFVRRHYGVTDGRFKLIHFYEPDVNQWELYDIPFSYNELSNVYGNPVYAPVRDRLAAELQRLRTELNVPEIDPADSYIENFPRRTR